VAADEDSVWKKSPIGVFQEVPDMYLYAWSAVATAVLADDGFALRTYLEGFDVEVRKEEACLDADATCAGSDIPEDMVAREVEGL
jgi:hypothetical protein